MKRRSFLRKALPVATLPYFMNGFSMKAFGKGSMFAEMLSATPQNDKILVLIQLNGGNDGLNTIIPLDQYSALSGLRSNILVPENLVLPLNGTAATGFHPAMTGLQQLYNDQKVSVIQGVSYPAPSFSHFRATDIWLTGSDSDQSLATGWLGRYLDEEFPGYPTGFPTLESPDPLALQIGNVASVALQGPSVNMGIAITSSTNFYQLVSGEYDETPDTPAGHELRFIRETSLQTQLYSTVIQNAAQSQANLSTLYPASRTNSLADQLKIVAQLIGGGLQTKVYIVNLGGFDTHNNQVDQTGGTQNGSHSDLLSKLSEAINAFQDDITLMGKQDKVLGMTFSEFGRRIHSNDSYGTDHGSSLPVILFGTQVAGGLVGDNPVISSDTGPDDNLEMQADFRTVYASILKNWFCIPPETVTTVLQREFPDLPLFSHNCGIASVKPVADFSGLSVYPNPAEGSVTVNYSDKGRSADVRIYDLMGKELIWQTVGSGIGAAQFSVGGFAAGTYFVKVIQQGNVETAKFVIR